MIVGLGVDLFDVARMEAELRRADPAFCRSIFTPAEIAACQSRPRPAEHYAARFAAKEAVVKALALDDHQAICWNDIDIRTADQLARVILRGRVRQLADGRGVTRILVSMASLRTVAVASVVLEARP